MTEQTPSAVSYVATLKSLLDQVATQAEGPVQDAAQLLADAVRAGGVIQAFGTGHSEALSMELSGRAGGLVATNRLLLSDLVLRGGEPAEILTNGALERESGLARRIYELNSPHAADAFVIASNSGVNGSIVEMAQTVKENGHPLIAITSVGGSKSLVSRHPSGQRLTDLADVVLDNGAPFGDSVLDLPGDGAVCAVSSITAALLAQMVTAEVVRRLLADGTPPIYMSANVPGGDEHNRTLEDRYDGRIRRTTQPASASSE
ncbi:sugar isomerase domain-containing protein [Demetria terragena]|uniref:sugar isomerase domain-containing protein n=1 Tax=Demetria terragena TaxID=63959 RepID=UPI0003613AA5|nr:SIS domain-containing protein [Demetria terragena]